MHWLLLIGLGAFGAFVEGVINGPDESEEVNPYHISSLKEYSLVKELGFFFEGDKENRLHRNLSTILSFVFRWSDVEKRDAAKDLIIGAVVLKWESVVRFEGEMSESAKEAINMAIHHAPFFLTDAQKEIQSDRDYIKAIEALNDMKLLLLDQECERSLMAVNV